MIVFVLFFFFFKQKTAYEMRISDWSSDVCSSDLMASSSRSYRLMFERLLEAMSERDACRKMVELLSMAHERACEAELADLLAQDLDEGRQIGRASCRERVCPYV